jgi:hypothetical protein
MRPGKAVTDFFDSDALLDKPGLNYNLVALLVASVAQLAEQLTLNQLVEGSSPSRGTTPSNAYASF